MTRARTRPEASEAGKVLTNLLGVFARDSGGRKHVDWRTVVDVCARSADDAAAWTLKPPRLSAMRHETVFSLACTHAPLEIVEALHRLKMHLRPAAAKFPPHRAPSAPLVAAAENEDPRVMEALLHSGWNANEADEEGDSALHRVLSDVSRVRTLLRHGGNPLQPNLVGMTPLALAEEQSDWYREALEAMRIWADGRDRSAAPPTAEWINTNRPYTLSALRKRRRENGQRFLWLAAPGDLSTCETAIVGALGGSVRVEHDVADRAVDARAGFFCLDLTGPWMVFLAVPGSARLSGSDRSNARRIAAAIAEVLGRCWILSDDSTALVTARGSGGSRKANELLDPPSRGANDPNAGDIALRGAGLELPYVEVTTDGIRPRLHFDAPRKLILAVHLLVTR